MQKISASTISTTMGPTEWTMVIILSILWGGSFFFVEIAVGAVPTLSIVVLRVGLAAAVLWIVVLASGRKIPRTPSVWLAFFGMGLLNNAIPFGLIVWGQQSISSGLASILNATTPLFGVLVAGALLFDERLSIRKVVGVLIGSLGVVVMIGPEALSGIDASVIAQFAILGAAMSYAFAGVFGRRFQALGVDPIVTAAGQVTATTILLAPIALFFDKPWTIEPPSITVLAALVGLAVLSTALAYILYFRILATAGATNLLLVTFLIPVSATLLGVGFLDESLSLLQVVGMALIAAGLCAIDGRLFAKR